MAESNFEISLEQVKEFRKATGCPIDKIRSVIEGMEPGLRTRILIAIKTQDDSIFRDPIEGFPQSAALCEYRLKNGSVG